MTTSIINSIKEIEQKVTAAMLAARKKFDEEEIKAVAAINQGLGCGKCGLLGVTFFFFATSVYIS